ncbi:hypothetical protein CcI6DRAFT_02892 [Frankia sp. CcI6]|nr:hypothetical protein CcI6DRAFT_02892 [Frankia sp. CcI6]KFB03846.1 hypothetical protein ALLO2DRAFT_03362 [Frankia sp. Allo2]OAA29104.1 hypothetical protein AAY23_101737 [Frankia casuarinae]OHV48508.1 hypothetical protein CgIS1_05720 [Frankia sp. CgIS1]
MAVSLQPEGKAVATVQKKVSDISGEMADDEEFGTLTVKTHPLLDAPCQLDILPPEVAAMKEAGDIVLCAVRLPGEDQARQFAVTLPEFRKVVPDAALEKARGVRGRRART